MFTKIGAVLPATMEKNGIAPKVARARALSAFEERARAALPDAALHGFRALRLEHGVLTVACRTSGTVRALQAVEAEVRAGLGECGVERVRLLLAPWR